MAIIFGDLGLSIVDYTRERTSVPVYWSAADTVTLAQLITDLAAVATAVNPLTAGNVQEALARIVVSGYTSTGPSGPETIEQVGLLQFRTNGTFPRAYGLAVPAILNTDLLTNSKKLNLANVNIAALTTLLIGGGTHTTYCDSHGHTLLSINKGNMVFRKHRKIASRA